MEVEQMVLGVQRRFAEELGWSLSPPMAFSLDTYIADLERAELAYKSQFGALAVLTRDRWTLMERFFETVVAKSREIFAAAERDTEAWVKSLLPPIELQVREQRAQLKKRAESISKIRDAQGSLDERIGELEQALEEAQTRLAALKRLTDRVQDIAARVPDEHVLAEEALAA
jgi:DNA repair exonuclease SbcCD ATPase subunit